VQQHLQQQQQQKQTQQQQHIEKKRQQQQVQHQKQQQQIFQQSWKDDIRNEKLFSNNILHHFCYTMFLRLKTQKVRNE